MGDADAAEIIVYGDNHEIGVHDGLNSEGDPREQDVSFPARPARNQQNRDQRPAESRQDQRLHWSPSKDREEGRSPTRALPDFSRKLVREQFCRDLVLIVPGDRTQGAYR